MASSAIALFSDVIMFPLVLVSFLNMTNIGIFFKIYIKIIYTDVFYIFVS